MSDIVLYGVPVSAFVAKVRVVLDMKGVTFDERPPPEGYGSAAYRAIVPAGSVPGLVTPEGALSDSTAIIEWLDDVHPPPPLRSGDPFARAQMRAMLGFHDTRLETAARQAFAPIKAGWRTDPRTRSAADGVAAALTRLEEIAGPRLSDQPFLGGAAPDLADCAYPATLQMAWMILDEVEAPRPHTHAVAAWAARLAEIEAVARSLIIAGEAMAAWLGQHRATS